jgi:cell wall-associated NlpC family hydrolase
MKTDEVIAAARECVGTPFMHQGRIVGRALDCAGMAIHVGKQFHDVIEPGAYGRVPNAGLLEYWLDLQPYLVTAPVTDLQPGDVLLMKFGKEPQHLAIYTGSTIIHAYQIVGRTVEHGLDDKWRRRIVRVYRFADIES